MSNSFLSRVLCHNSPKIISLTLLLTFPFTTLFEGGALAVTVGSSATASGSAASQLGQIAESAGLVQSFQADLFTGRAQTSIPIFVPPGRKNIQPNLSLSYSSSGGNSWLGIGWSLDLGFIQRDVKRGVPAYNSSDKYIFSFQGVNSELVLVATNEFRAKDEALFLKFILDPVSNSWIVSDKSGTKYFFGSTADSRQSSSLGTFKWALSKVTDTLGNTMNVNYISDAGQLYLSSIDYNGNDGGAAPPGGAQSFPATHRIEFTLEDREDKSFSFISGTRVDFNKRLKEINVEVKDSQGIYKLARKYVITYEISAATKHSRLKTVTEYGTDGVTSLPAVTFTYQDKPLGFEPTIDFTGVQNDSNVGTSGSFIRRSPTEWGWTKGLSECLDLNGDGFVDRIQKMSDNTKWKFFSNQNGSSFGNGSEVTGISIPDSTPEKFHPRASTEAGATQADLVDLNADGLPDRIVSTGSSTWSYQKNTGGAFASPVTVNNIISADGSANQYQIGYTTAGPDSITTVDLVDINGDGIPDRVMSGWDDRFKVQLGSLDANGQPQFSPALTDFTGLQTPYGGGVSLYRNLRYYTINDSNYSMAMVELMDINGDGLPDRVMNNPTDPTKWKVQFNNGKSFEPMQDWGPIENPAPGNGANLEKVRSISNTGRTHTDLLDINGDGLPDRVIYNNSSSWYVQINNGTGFETKQLVTGIEYAIGDSDNSFIRMTSSSGNLGLDLLDINGDGLPDRILTESAATVWKVQKNKGPFPDLLSVIDNSRGGKTTITYSPSTSFDNTDTSGKQRLPFPIQVVTQVKQEDGVGNSYITNYSFKGGLFDATAREFRGFREVTVTDAQGTKTITTFGQDNQTKGKQLAKEVRDSLNNLFSKEVTTWGDTQPWGAGVDVHFVHVDQQDNYIYDGDSTYKQTQQTFSYDSYGNLVSTTENGDVSITGDERKTVNTYVYDTMDYIVNTLSKTTLYDSDLTTVKSERYFYYDGATSITTVPVKGLLTKEEEWLSTASGCSTPGPCTNNPKTQMTYDNYGNVSTVTDARGYVTTNTYETTYNLFLTQISNALSQTRQFTYDPWIAQILTSTDQNGQVTTTQYDVLGRVTKVISPLDSSTEPTQEFVYDLSSVPNKTTTKVKSSVPGQTFTQLITYSFTDGLGREIQRRSPAKDSTKQIVSGAAEFDNRGQVKKQYVPYFVNTSTSYVATDTTQSKATFTYDAVGRRTRVDYPDSTFSTVVFSDFVKTTTDQRGKQMRYTNDAYGRLIKVEEFPAGGGSASGGNPQTYTTTYEYDSLNNLKKTTDNAGNVTTITFDSLSRKTGMTDPDMGTWSYSYDTNDNLSSQTDAKNQTISFTYDALNRVTLKDLPAGETDVTYTYDDPLVNYSKGRLTKVADASGTHEFTYDALGRVLTDKKTVDSVAYTFTRTYDAMGRVQTLTYPDTEVVTYTYNNFGDVDTIQGVKNSVTTDYVKQVDYNASGQITFMKYGNNVTSNYTYDANTLRLNNILTKKPDGTTKLQDLSYTFDGIGNVTHIADVVNNMTQDFTYDDLNRLVSATGSAYGTQTFQYDSIGNMTKKNNFNMSYGITGGTKPHAVTAVTWSSGNGPTFCRDQGSSNCTMTYDANGNMTQRAGDILSYDSENRLAQMKSYEGTDGSQSYTLQPGWNVISFPYLPDNKSVSNILSSLTFGTDYDQVSYWDATSSSWKNWVNDSDFNDFTSFEFGKTYEIYINKATAVSLTVSGKSAAVDITHSIKSGDNFISPAVKAATNVSTILGSLVLGTDYSDVKRFNASTQTWESYVGGAFSQFEPGKGYNITGLRNASFTYGKTETITSFVYDSTGARVKKVTPSATTIYLGKDYEVEGSLTTKHIFLGDRRITTKKSNGDIFFIHSDHINSSNVITDATGNQSALYEYDPYGSTVTHTGSAELKHKFTGQEEDSSTRLYYYGARYYDPQLGRFITADEASQNPFDPQALNRYAYVRNNPIKYTDPSGFGWFSKLIGAIVGAIAFVASGFNPAVGIAAFSAVDATISARQNGASWGKALMLGAVGIASGIVGGAAGSTIGSAFGFGAGSLGGNVFSGAFAGAFAGGFTSAVAGGNSVLGGLAGAAGGAVGGSFGASFGGALAGSFAGGGVSSVVSGGKFINGAVDGIYNAIGMTVVSFVGFNSQGTSIAELVGKGKLRQGDLVFIKPELDPISLAASFLDPGPISHVMTYNGNGEFTDSSSKNGGPGIRTLQEMGNRKGWVFHSNPAQRSAIAAASRAMGVRADIRYFLPPFGHICSTLSNTIRVQAGAKPLLGVGPNTQFFNNRKQMES